ncbi:DDB1- and CUL4-associated factor 8 [Portunus trituberculatus]|uniref:DDB1-and CUL4-associated factor 8 n=1 Tax=Portunus trituberculatus TaxID=210409 RepID=A0A5B7JIB8_PORTR|nr:DDB1- and CUL4-associated factor 8 [Portunus trituberculatus]
MLQVNVLEPHPHIPVLATSGLDDDIKIWVPTCEEDPQLSDLEQIVKTNLEKRHKERNEDSNVLDTEMLMVLWHHIRRTDRRHQRVGLVLYQGEFLVKVAKYTISRRVTFKHSPLMYTCLL